MTFASLFSRRRKQLYSREDVFCGQTAERAAFSDEIFQAKEISFLEIFQKKEATSHKKKVMKLMTLKVVVMVHPFR